MTGADELPPGFRITPAPGTSEIRPGTWFGGRPARALTVAPRAREAWARLMDGGPVSTRVDGVLARRFVDAGLVHPLPPDAAARDVTVVVPVYGRPDALDRCLAALGDRYHVLVVDDASPDELAVRAVAQRHGARVLRLPTNQGPGAARNAGRAAVTSELIAFVDSDTVPAGTWIEQLAAHFADPTLAAIAPRITPVSTIAYAAARSCLDLGSQAGYVRPYAPVSYLPSTALLVRRDALPAFDEQLRVGEDVDLIWRLVEAGRRVRYEPSVTVGHVEPATWPALLRRRFRYGTSAAALSRRHPYAVAPLVVHPWFTASAVALLVRRPAFAVVTLGAAVAGVGRQLTAAGIARRHRVRLVGGGLLHTWLGIGRYVLQFATPVLVAGLLHRRTRPAALALGLAPPIAGWRARRAPIGPVRFATGYVADEIAYGGGVLTGCFRQRTFGPLRPITADRSR